MYLKSVEMQGFKSFVDRTHLAFEGGITGIVGPNGSGKSNISDAIRWVMGEMSVKSLRGSKMEDVIFSGTEKRKPVGFAEVTLTIDNSDRFFNIDFKDLVVTRRVYRSGESEYLINGSTVRLRDIHELFMDTGLGRDGYSIIGQGKIDEILSTKSDDRRGIFEEAAGIAKYRYRKEEAERKLKGTEENLVRLADIINELEAQIGPLFEQSEKAKVYLALKEEYKVLDVNLCLENIDKNKRALSVLVEQFDLVTAELNELDKNILDISENTDRSYAEIKAIDEELSIKREELSEVKDNEARLINEVMLLNQSLDTNKEEIARIAKEKSELKGRINTILVEIEELKKEQLDLKKAESEINEQIASLAAAEKEITDKILSKTMGHESLAQEVMSCEKLISSLKAKGDGFSSQESLLLSRKETIEKQICENEGYINKTNADIKENEDSIALLAAKTDEVFKNIAAGEKEKDEISRKIIDTDRKISECIIDKNEKISKINMLKDFERDYEGYFNSVKTVIKAAKNGELKGIVGTVADLLSVPDKYITATEVALGSGMQNIVVDSEEDAKRAIGYLKEKKGGRATFLPLSSVTHRPLENIDDIRKNKGVLGLASELCSYDKKYDKVVSSLLARIVIVDNIDNAISLSKKYGYKFRTVTLTGELLAPGGSVSGGSSGRSTSIWTRSSEIKKLEQSLSLIESKHADLLNSKKELSSLLSEKESSLNEIRLGNNKFNDMLIAKKQLILSLNERLKQVEMLNSGILYEKKANARDLDALCKEREECAAEIEKLELRLGELNSAVNSQRDDTSDDNKAREEIIARINAENLKLELVRKDISVIDNRILEKDENIKNLKNEIDNKNNDIVKIEETNVVSGEDISKKQKKSDELKEMVSLLADEIDKGQEKRSALEEGIKNMQDDFKTISENKRLLTIEQERAFNKKSKSENDSENLINILWDEYGLTYSTASEYRKDIGSLTAAGKRINELKGRIRELGSVNVDAIDMYKDVSERYEFLKGQKTDLDEAKVSLEGIITSMQDKMKKSFKEQFAIINDNFKQVFTELFGGGMGELVLSEPDNILESGIEIQVQPPGKKLQNISLLSGGEKAFTAIALLFAILKTKPTPFCVLDEIEAALDDVNVYRFSEYVSKFKGTQFIIVTHRRGTMEGVDILYGITMQEKGVSKALSLKLSDVAR